VAKLPDLFLDRTRVASVPARRIRWKATYRLQSARHPPVAYFERIAGPDDQRVLEDLESLTDPAARQAIGRISLVPPSRRVFGAGASAVMGPFTHASKDNPSRFTDGSYGVYYAGSKFETALREIAFHRGRFHAMTGDPPTKTTFKTIVAGINKMMHDIRKGDWADVLDPDPARYAKSQALAAQLKGSGSNGVVYPGVRHSGGECLAAFWPNVPSSPTAGKRISIRWDGAAIVAWFDYETNEWANL